MKNPYFSLNVTFFSSVFFFQPGEILFVFGYSHLFCHIIKSIVPYRFGDLHLQFTNSLYRATDIFDLDVFEAIVVPNSYFSIPFHVYLVYWWFTVSVEFTQSGFVVCVVCLIRKCFVPSVWCTLSINNLWHIFAWNDSIQTPPQLKWKYSVQYRTLLPYSLFSYAAWIIRNNRRKKKEKLLSHFSFYFFVGSLSCWINFDLLALTFCDDKNVLFIGFYWSVWV